MLRVVYMLLFCSLMDVLHVRFRDVYVLLFVYRMVGCLLVSQLLCVLLLLLFSDSILALRELNGSV